MREGGADGFPKSSPPLVLMEHDRVIEKLPSHAAYQALGHPVLPGASERRAPGADAKARHRRDDLGGEGCVVVEGQESVCRVVGEDMAQKREGSQQAFA